MRGKIAMGDEERGGIHESYDHLLLQPPSWVEILRFKSQPPQMVWRLLKGVESLLPYSPMLQNHSKNILTL